MTTTFLVLSSMDDVTLSDNDAMCIMIVIGLCAVVGLGMVVYNWWSSK
jgi:hypothetical protein